MTRPIHESRFAAGALLLATLMGCGGSKGDAAKNAAPPAATPAAPAGAPAGASGSTPVSPPASSSAGGTTRRIVATVNGAQITASKVDSVYRMNKSMLEQRGRSLNATDDQALKAQSLEAVISDELLAEAATAKGVTVPASEVDTALKQVKARAGSEAAYAGLLAESGLTEAEVYKEVERNLKIEVFRKSLTAGKGVSEEQAKKYYDENVSKGIFNVPEGVHIQYILVKAAEGDAPATRADAKKRAEEAAKRARAGEDFSALAKQYSQDPTATRGGDIGFIPRGVMPPKFEEVAFASKPGAVSEVFETPKGFSVLKVLEKKPAATRKYDEVKSALMRELGRLMEQDVVGAKVRELASTASINILDRSYAPPAPPSQASAQPPPKP